MYIRLKSVRIPLDMTIWVVLSILFVITGCQTGPKYSVDIEADRYLLTKAHRPDYAPGEYFVYDDGTSALVTGVSKGLVSWKHNNGATSKGYPNFIIPDLSWTSANRTSEGRTSAPPDLLWPLGPGKRGQFDFQQTISHKDGSPPDTVSRRWTCTVEGTATVSVPAGEFDTIVIACNRYSSTSGSWRATRRYYYAPALNHYVIREEQHHRRQDTRRELVNYGFNSTVLPRQDQIKLNQTLQAALTRNKDGRASHWTSRSGDISAMLVPVRSYTGPDGQSCRDYHSIYSVKGRVSDNAREVCRQPDGSWQRVD
jgi:hypothetical protein